MGNKLRRQAYSFGEVFGRHLPFQTQKVRTDIPSLKTKAEQGDPDAQCSLGMLLAEGEGVPQNDAEALKLALLVTTVGGG